MFLLTCDLLALSFGKTHARRWLITISSCVCCLKQSTSMNILQYLSKFRTTLRDPEALRVVGEALVPPPPIRCAVIYAKYPPKDLLVGQKHRRL